jgi:Tol biopolymer transport system component
MNLAAGTQLGPYQIVALIGKGGMGEVYRAHDPRLGRDVAIKVSKEQFSERFEREARAVAALNHPNICHLYDVGPNYLVLELVEGESPKGPLPLDEALKIARQIADALEAAHEKGIVHRDLKPANIKITPDGTVKVLDFGLAKVLDDDPAPGSIQDSPTLTLSATRAGMILGTAAYMSPEQAKGQRADRRGDIWSFGVVLYELLTGRQLFTGDSAGEIMASVIKEEPKLDMLPASVRPIVEHCLRKDFKKRWQAIGDVRIALEEVGAYAVPVTAPSRSPFGRIAAGLAALFILAFAALAFTHFREIAPPERVLRYTVSAPGTLHSLAVSPDGRSVVVAAMANDRRQLWLRPLDALQFQAMPGTEDAAYPFWSPDARYIGFFAQGKLKKVPVSGGPAQSLCDAADGRGGSWNRDDVIVFSPVGGTSNAIQRVSASGGVPADVTGSTGTRRFPIFMPDGRRFLYLMTQLSAEQNGIYLASLDGKENRRVLSDVSGFAFASSASGSRLLFIRENTLMAQPLDSGSGQPSGEVFPVAEAVGFTTVVGYAPLAVSENGVLLYASSGSTVSNQIVWMDRAGKPLESPGTGSGEVWYPSISPDEKAMAFSRTSGTSSDIWYKDLARQTDTRVTLGRTNLAPFWSPKGDDIIFSAARGGPVNLFHKSPDGLGQPELVLSSPNFKLPSQWTRDGKFIVYSETSPKTKWDIWVLPAGNGISPDKKPIPFLQTEFDEFQGQMSPDGHWMAYTSDESGQQREVYVRPFPASDGSWRISTAGGQQARWRADGKELFFVAADGKMMSVAVKTVSGPKAGFEAGIPTPLFEAHMAPDIRATVGYNYDLTGDGKRFLVNRSAGTGATAPLTVVVNWNAGLKK